MIAWLRLADAARLGFWLVLIGSVVLFELVVDRGIVNLHTLQARAFLDGQLALDVLERDVAIVNGRYFVTFPPWPSVLLMPLVALFGMVDTSIVAAGLTLLNVYTISRICARYELSASTVTWLLFAYLLGTPYWSALKFSSDVWHFAHIVAFTFLLLAIRFALIERNIWLASFALGAAILSRQLSIYAFPFIIACHLEARRHRMSRAIDVREIIRTGLKSTAVLAPFGLAYLYFNWLRFGDPLDDGYMYLYHIPFLQERLSLHGLFHPAFIPFNFAYMFLQGPHVVFDGLEPVSLDPFGTALTFSSPFLFLMAFRTEQRWLLYVALASSALALIHMLMYFNNGWIQVNGPRFALDFIPMLLLVTIQFVRQAGETQLFRVLVGYSVALNTFALIGLPALTRLL
jgi:hypothetical protein